MKLFIREKGSDVLRSYLSRTDYQAVASAIASVELQSALHRRLRSGELTRAEVQTASTGVSETLSVCIVQPISAVVVAESIRLIRSHSLRSLDALQLAAAITFFKANASGNEAIFIASDHRLGEAALSEGLVCWDPATSPTP